ncbi:hypothetical protein [Jiella avicenniae]|uniref:Phage integrase family protein n=1 Tax=Jiella avicenniae TaxID=2907202 RepID=A0A9X1NVP7_9HYPH|nr:hypothetical protein [Jiella avicenniae]MCE7026392.1 hypothetical protein [Jiella avicenniae]
MADPKIPNVSWRGGRPRFTPGEPIRKLGYKAADLKRADGAWMSAGEALDWALAKAAEIAAVRGGAAAAAKPGERQMRGPMPYSLADLFRDWQRSPRWGAGEARGKRVEKVYSANTRRDYRQKMRVVEDHDQDLYNAAVEALSEQILFGLYEDLWETRGLHTANGVIRTLSAAISWGRRRGKVKLATNPAMRLGMQTPAPRVRFAERAEIEALVAAADAMGRPEIGDAVTLGLWTGQRQNDRLALVVHRSALMSGRRVFRQQKTGAIVSVLDAPELERRLTAASARRRAKGIVDPHVILDEATWKPFKPDWYRHVFAEVRASAAKVLPSVADLRDQDLRDTAVTWMALGRAEPYEIASVTGHSFETVHSIMKHYLAIHPEMSDSAIGKMVARWDQAGKEDEAL